MPKLDVFKSLESALSEKQIPQLLKTLKVKIANVVN